MMKKRGLSKRILAFMLSFMMVIALVPMNAITVKAEGVPECPHCGGTGLVCGKHDVMEHEGQGYYKTSSCGKPCMAFGNMVGVCVNHGGEPLSNECDYCKWLSACKHNFIRDYKDAYYHGKECRKCGEIIDKESHTLTDGKCSICGYACEHSIISSSVSYLANADYHWKKTCGVCGEIIDKESHTDTNNDGICDTCRYSSSSGAILPGNNNDEFKLNICNIPSEGGSTYCEKMPISYSQGTSATFTAKPNPGYRFKGWYAMKSSDASGELGTCLSLEEIYTITPSDVDTYKERESVGENTYSVYIAAVYEDSTVHTHSKRTLHAKVDATCNETGTLEYWDCSCGEKLDADGNVLSSIEIAATGNHNFLEEDGSYLSHCKFCNAEAPKCGENAYYEYDETSKTLRIYGSGSLYNNAFNVNYGAANLNNDEQRALIARNMKKVIIGKDITELAVSAFRGNGVIGDATNSQLEIVEFEEGSKLTVIGDDAFYACKSLSSFSMPDSVKTIGIAVFCDCDNLSSVTLSNNLETIGYDAFNSCKKLENVVIPPSVTTIEGYAFAYCDNLLNISIASPLVEIGNSSLEGDYNLENVHVSCSFNADIEGDSDASAYWEDKGVYDLDIVEKDIHDFTEQPYVADEDGIHHNQKCKYCDHVAQGNHDFSTSPDKCSICGFYADLIGAKLAGYSLSLHDNIGVDFYMELADSVMKDEGAKFIFKLEGDSLAEIPVSEAQTTTVNGNTYYVFECRVAAAQMTGCISAKIVLGDGTEGTEYQFTVQDYAKYILEHEAEYEEVVPVVKAMLRYGASAQNYFGHNTDKMADEILSEADRTAALTTPELTTYNYSAPEATDTISFLGTSLLLESEVSLKCYFYTTVDLQYSNVIVKYGDKVLDTSDYQIGKNGNVQYVTVTGLTPADYGKQFTITVQDITVENVSAYGYMAQAFKQMGDSDKLTDLLKNMYAYGEAYKKCYKLL